MQPYALQIDKIAFDDIDFTISVAEIANTLPFSVKRIYWLKSNSLKHNRGRHAHVNSYQFLISLAGNISLTALDKTEKKYQFDLHQDSAGIVIPPNHWLEIEMSPHAILLCLSSELFKDQISIFDYEKFISGQ